MRLLVCLLFAACASAPPNGLDQALRRYEQYGLSGTVVVKRHGATLLRKGYGYANRERRVANSPTTVYYFASVLKQFTAAAILALEADGKLSTDDPLSRFFPGAPNVTLQQLLLHTSGVVREPGAIEVPPTRIGAIRQLLALPLQSAPGSTYSYSNVGYTILAAVVEKVSGMTYESFVRHRLLAPAHMRTTGWRTDFDDAAVARGYSVFAPPDELPNLPPHGALVGSPEDLTRWAEALAANEVLPPKEREKLYTPFLDDYIYGSWTTRDAGGRRKNIADGDYPGYQIQLVRYLDDDTTYAMGLNVDGDWARHVDKVIEHFLFGSEMPPLPPATGTVDAGVAGSYRFPTGGALDVKLAGGAFIVTPNGQAALSAVTGQDPADVAAINDAARAVMQKLIAHDDAGASAYLRVPKTVERLRHFLDLLPPVPSVDVLGSVVTRGGVETHVRLNGPNKIWELYFREGKLAGWETQEAGLSVYSAMGPRRFVMTAGGDLASFNPNTGQTVLLRVVRRGGGIVALESAAGARADK
ncbi:MAG TPA: serine hydrolase domain-containing protein [Thermoanaerobaculia bacterium]|nr:serine hydrolase domain-containing protein [Thermoanaerobaculia bacterium]